MYSVKLLALAALAVLLVGIPSATAQGSWSTVTNPTGPTDRIESVFMVSASDGWAVGNDGMIFNYTSPVVIPEYPFGLPLLAILMVTAYGLLRRRSSTL
jgi:hypothetical protein